MPYVIFLFTVQCKRMIDLLLLYVWRLLLKVRCKITGISLSFCLVHYKFLSKMLLLFLLSLVSVVVVVVVVAFLCEFNYAHAVLLHVFNFMEISLLLKKNWGNVFRNLFCLLNCTISRRRGRVKINWIWRKMFIWSMLFWKKPKRKLPSTVENLYCQHNGLWRPSWNLEKITKEK